MMKQTLSLSGAWTLTLLQTGEVFPAQVPGSVYADLLRARRIEDPFYRDNEAPALALMEGDFLYARTFEVPASLLEADALVLRCEGLDTVADVFLNDALLFHAENMHRTFEFDAKPFLRIGENHVEVKLYSPTQFIRRAYAQCRCDGTEDALRGFALLRKAHCMFGWDWGPHLPDAGIWREISLVAVHTARFEDVRVHQEHENGEVTLSFDARIDRRAPGEVSVRYELTTPEGDVLSSAGEPLRIAHPQLWWPNGLGSQPLYTLRALLVSESDVLDERVLRIGLRTLTMKREKDAWGESFATTVNGVSFFAMGADYIPEDNILSRVNKERTRALLTDCVLAHHNAIRVWGGGYYPGDDFFDLCDELGLVVWQDCMFACAVYPMTPDFAQNVAAEIHDNLRRIRHHASLGLLCGNNEMEMFVASGEWLYASFQKADYLYMYEKLIADIAREEAPDVFYWPASPSSGGGFDEPNSPDRGDVHYWEVWHGNKPFTEYRRHFFRYASEFGFESFPCLKSVEAFTLEQDRNIFSYVMEKHQRCGTANGKIMNYLAQTFLYPGSFDTLLYASQLLQAEAIRYGVEHWRRHRGRCMGAIYWQLNDCWPVASWASIDYYGRWKALHYASKRFFAPVLLSCEEEGTLTQRVNVNWEAEPLRLSARLNVSNETQAPFDACVRWALRTPRAEVLQSGEENVTVPALSARWLPVLPFPNADERNVYLSYDLYTQGQWVSGGTALFCAPKHFCFEDPHLRCTREADCITVTADAYARSVEIVMEGDAILEDNYFDLNASSRTVKILRGEPGRIHVRSVYDIR